LEWFEKDGKEIQHPSMHHHRLIAFLVETTRREQWHVADAIQRHKVSPARVRRRRHHFDPGESHVHHAATALLGHETPRRGGGGGCAQLP